MKKIKVVVDILMFAITLLLIEMEATGLFLHEVLGLTLALLFALHIILNFKWVKNITKSFKKTNRKTKILYFVDIATFISYVMTVAFGISISAKIFHFSVSSLNLLLLHNIFGRLSAIMMLVHLGFHLNLIIRKLTKNETIKAVIYILYIALTTLGAMYLFYSLTKTYIWSYYI